MGSVFVGIFAFLEPTDASPGWLYLGLVSSHFRRYVMLAS